MRPFVVTFAVIGSLCSAALALPGCGQDVNCENLCKRSLACEVSFGPEDDPEGKKVKSGERTDLESCTLGCEENPAVTVDSAECSDAVEVTTAAECQQPMLKCFGAN